MSEKWLYIVLLASLLMGGCSTPYESLDYQEITSVDEIDSERFQYDQKSGMMYLISNDGDSLYIALKFPERVVKAKVLRKGLTVWLDPSAKKGRAYGVKYPVDGLPGMGGRQGKSFGQPEVVEGEDGFKRFRYPEKAKKDSIPELALSGLQIKLLGFDEKQEQSHPATESPFPVKLYFDQNNTLTYTLAVSLKAINKAHFDDGDALSVGVVTGAFEKPGNRPGIGSGGRNGGGRRGGMNPGVMGGAGQRPRPDFNRLTVQEELWIKKVYLSIQEAK
ncbi:MAG TPA: hypothetical protein VJ939_01050 [Bacteroidales bacterium]|nr:hypothetical protein [Bacteroidales bacterium]